jgi:tetratricopeptide (TPR) repeat protein
MDSDGRVGLKSAPDALLNRAREKTRGYPRALEALYAILSVDRYTTLEELLEISLPGEVVQKLVGEAFNRLDPGAQKVMQALAVYNRPVSPGAVDYLLQPHLPSIDSALVLNRLVNMHFARREAGRYYLHPADKEYAFSIIPVEKDLTTNDTKVTTEKQRKPLRTSRLTAFTQHDLTSRAADYFRQARKPRAEWKKLEDLNAQLAEFNLRCAAGEYDTAASVLTEIDGDYLLLWGHYRLMIDIHEKLRGKVQDKTLDMLGIARLGLAYEVIGRIQEFIKCQEQALIIARETSDHYNEGAWLGNLGNAYFDLGNVHKAIEYYEQALAIAREIGDREGEGSRLGNLGNAYAGFGDVHKAIEYYEQALAIAREIGNREGEGINLNNLGNRYGDLGDVRKAIEFYEQALVIAREIGDRSSEGTLLNNIGESYANLNLIDVAIINYEQALVIRREIFALSGIGSTLGNLARAHINKVNYKDATQFAYESIAISQEINSPLLGSRHTYTLTLAHLFSGEINAAFTVIEKARDFDISENNHNVTALHGIIALRQGESETAQEAFAKSIAQADEILAKTPEYYSALDAKGLALCGSAVSREWRVENSKERDDIVAEAVKTFKRAREIAPHAGVVKSVLRLFDELVKCDEEGVLKDLRKAAEGS